MDCIFCKILDKKLPAMISYEDKQVIAFDDINSKAPIHKLIVPRKHIATINDITAEDKELMGHILQVAQQLARDLKVAESGYRLVLNCNQQGGQEVYHIHLHLLAGKQMTWPPGC